MKLLPLDFKDQLFGGKNLNLGCIVPVTKKNVLEFLQKFFHILKKKKNFRQCLFFGILCHLQRRSRCLVNILYYFDCLKRVVK